MFRWREVGCFRAFEFPSFSHDVVRDVLKMVKCELPTPHRSVLESGFKLTFACLTLDVARCGYLLDSETGRYLESERER